MQISGPVYSTTVTEGLSRSAYLSFTAQSRLILSMEVAIKVLRSNKGDGYVAWEDQISAMKRVCHFPSLRKTVTIRLRLSQHLYRETSVWSVLDHENVLKFLGVDPTHGYPGGCPALISPYCVNGTVTQYLRQNPGVDRLLLASSLFFSYVFELTNFRN